MKNIRYFFLAVLIILLSGCGGSRPRYIFLITLDTMRADAVDYSPGNPHTPNLAKLANNGIRFDNAYSVIPITLPSHASMFYSRHPHELKLYNNGQINTRKIPSLSQILKGHGFSTGAVISLGVLKSDFGLHSGFDHYYEEFSPGMWSRNGAEVNGDLFDLIPRLKGKPSFVWAHYSDPHEPYFPPWFDGKFSIMVNEKEIYSINNQKYPLVDETVLLQPGENRIRFDTRIPTQMGKGSPYALTGVTYKDLEFIPGDTAHTEIRFPDNLNKAQGRNKYFTTAFESLFTIINKKDTPSKLTLRFMYKLTEANPSKRKLYYKSVEYMDRQIGKLIGFLNEEGILDQSVILIAGDHGEGLGEFRSHYGHIHYLSKVYSHVPFIIHGKGIPKGRIRKDLASNLDVATTILGLAGVKIPPGMKGTPLLSGKGKTRLLLETFSPEAFNDAVSIVELPYQVILYSKNKNNQIEFRDLNSPDSSRTTSGAKVPDQLRARLRNSVMKKLKSIMSSKEKVGKPEGVHKDILKSLGYL